MVSRQRSLMRKDPSKPNGILRDIQNSTSYAHLLEKPECWVAPSAIGPLALLAPLADGLPGNVSAATAAEGLDKGGQSAAKMKNLKKAAFKRSGRRFGSRKHTSPAFARSLNGPVNSTRAARHDG